MEPFSVPAHALFQPSKSKLDALVKKDYLGKSKVSIPYIHVFIHQFIQSIIHLFALI